VEVCGIQRNFSYVRPPIFLGCLNNKRSSFSCTLIKVLAYYVGIYEKEIITHVTHTVKVNRNVTTLHLPTGVDLWFAHCSVDIPILAKIVIAIFKIKLLSYFFRPL
jgi:hypothetical protein